MSEPAARPVVRPHRGRFLVIYGLLAAVLVAGVAGVVLWAGRAINTAPAWSAWKPSGGGLGAATQIAAHVGVTYHLPGGKQLVDVIAKGPSWFVVTQQVPFHYVSLRGAKGARNSLFPIDSSNTLVYSLCGLGPSCSIAPGTPLVEVDPLVRREVLELALYTFKYIGGMNHVIALMPRSAGAPPLYAIYLERSDLSEQLKMPLARTLTPKVPRVAAIDAREQQTIDSIMRSRLYKFSLAQSQQNDPILVLAPFSP